MTGGNPQVEDGYTRIANELLDALISADLSKRERKVIDVIMRFSYGCGKKWVSITEGEIEALTGIKKPNVSLTIKGLLAKKIITQHGPQTYELNKHYLTWQVDFTCLEKRMECIKSVVKRNLDGSKDSPGGYQNNNPGGQGYQNDNPRVIKTITQGLLKQEPQGYQNDNPKCIQPAETTAKIASERNIKEMERNIKRNIPPYNPPKRGDVFPPSSFSHIEKGKEGDRGYQEDRFQEELIGLYHKILPMCPKVKVWSKRSRKNVLKICTEHPDLQTLSGWEGYFRQVAQSPFLTGQKTDFIATLDWLVKPSNFEKVMNGRYSHEYDEITAGIEAWARKKGLEQEEENPFD